MVPEYQEPHLRELIIGPLRILYTLADPMRITILACVRSERPLDPEPKLPEGY